MEPQCCLISPSWKTTLCKTPDSLNDSFLCFILLTWGWIFIIISSTLAVPSVVFFFNSLDKTEVDLQGGGLGLKRLKYKLSFCIFYGPAVRTIELHEQKVYVFLRNVLPSRTLFPRLFQTLVVPWFQLG